ncbi:MAG: class B sortase [Faecalibacillus faecis]
MPGTRINYPIVQGSDDEEYLHRTFLKKRNSSGAIFLEAKCKKDFTSENNIIYGHHMRNGTMFADLVNYEIKDLLKSTI